MNILIAPHPILTTPAEDIPKSELSTITELTQKMFHLIEDGVGVGLAAPQIGILYSLFITNVVDDKKRVFINPVVTKTSSDTVLMGESCLSVPSIHATVVRPRKVTIKYRDLNWKQHTDTFDDILARVIFHEYDHLQGKLLWDNVNRQQRRDLQKKYAKFLPRYLKALHKEAGK